jgi:hypothetical protein
LQSSFMSKDIVQVGPLQWGWINIAKVEIGDVGQQPQRRPGRVEQQNAPRRILRPPPAKG